MIIKVKGWVREYPELIPKEDKLNFISLLKQIKPTENGCLLWSSEPMKYGKYSSNTCDSFTHVLSYLIFHGSIKRGDIVRHTCDMKACVNPKHLIIGSHTDNANDIKEDNITHFMPEDFKQHLIKEILSFSKTGKTLIEIKEILTKKHKLPHSWLSNFFLSLKMQVA